MLTSHCSSSTICASLEWCKNVKATLQHIAKIKAGHPFRGSIQESRGGNGHVIQLRDVDGDAQINWQALVRAEISGRKQPDWLKRGNIIFSARGSRNLASVVPDIDIPVVCSPHFFIIDLKDREDVLPEFITWQLNQTQLQKYFQQSAEGSVHVSIRKAVLEQAQIVIPHIEKQKIIVELASRVLKEKKSLEKLIELRRLEMDAVAKDILK